MLLLIPLASRSQCKNFAKKICKLELTPYIHDGNYNAAILSEGEEAELFKTFYQGQAYRIAVCGSESMPTVQFTVTDLDHRVLYTNASNNFISTWDFTVEATQQLIIKVKVPHDDTSPADGDNEPTSGCVAIMFGLKAE